MQMLQAWRGKKKKKRRRDGNWETRAGRCYSPSTGRKNEEGVFRKLGDWGRSQDWSWGRGWGGRGGSIRKNHQKEKGKSKRERKTKTSVHLSTPPTGRTQKETNWQRSLRNTNNMEGWAQGWERRSKQPVQWVNLKNVKLSRKNRVSE